MAEKLGQDIVDCCVSANAENSKQSLFANQDEGCNPPKRRRNSDEGQRLIRMLGAAAGVYSVSSNVNARAIRAMQIFLSPTCSCPDCKKNGSLGFCNHILVLLRLLSSAN